MLCSINNLLYHLGVVFFLHEFYVFIHPHLVQNYNSLDSMEPAKVIVEKDQSAFDATMLSEIDRTVKKHMENMLHVLEGVSARLTQLETRTHHLENSVDDLKVSVGNSHGSTDGKLRQMENSLREVFYL